MVMIVTTAADHSRPEVHSACISRQTSSGGGNSSARTPVCVATYQPPNSAANSPNWMRKTISRSRRITTNPGRAISSLRRPRESGDPYPPTSAIWIPAWAGTTREYVVMIVNSSSLSPVRVARLAHARHGGPDLVAQQRVELVADRAELAREHEIGRARMRLR